MGTQLYMFLLNLIILTQFKLSGQVVETKLKSESINTDIQCVQPGIFGEKCSKTFYICVLDGLKYHLYWQNCPDSTVFDPSLSNCNWERGMECETTAVTGISDYGNNDSTTASMTPTEATKITDKMTSRRTTMDYEMTTEFTTSDFYQGLPSQSTTHALTTTSNPLIINSSTSSNSWTTSISNEIIQSTTPKMDCTVTCFSNKFKIDWIACAGQTITKNCTNGIMTWTCLENGQFDGNLPDISDCETLWLAELMNSVARNRTLKWEDAHNFLNKLHHNVEMAMDSAHNNEDNEYQFYGHEITNILLLGPSVLAKVETKTIQTNENLTGIVLRIYEDVLHNHEAWDQLSQVDCSKYGSSWLYRLEKSLLLLSSTVVTEQKRKLLQIKNATNNDDDSNIITLESYRRDFIGISNTFYTSLGVIKTSEAQTQNQSLEFPINYNPDTDSFLKLPDDWTTYVDEWTEFIGTILDCNHTNYLFPAFYNMNDSESEQQNNTIIVNGPLMSFTFGEYSTQSSIKFKQNGIIIHIEHDVEAWGSEVSSIPRKLGPNEKAKAVQGSATCVFWNYEQMMWDPDGCFLIEISRYRTTCECFHLTSFAVIMTLHNYNGKDFALEILTWILCSISIICLGVTILTFYFVKSVKSTRLIITRHLCTCLMIGMILILLLMDRNVILTSDTICQIIGAFIHYIFLCTFIWMLFEGILLYRMIIIVFETGRGYLNIQRIIAYGLPLIIVGATFILGIINKEKAYGGDAICWLEGNYEWAFLGPVLIVVICNAIILIVCLKVAYSVQQNHPSKTLMTRVTSYKQWVRGAFSTSMLLGMTWIFGYFMLVPNATISKIFSYLFTILNASQGIFLFCFHCIGNKSIRAIYSSKLSDIYQSSSDSKNNSSNLDNNNIESSSSSSKYLNSSLNTSISPAGGIYSDSERNLDKSMGTHGLNRRDSPASWTKF